jgi:hypothetical protein
MFPTLSQEARREWGAPGCGLVAKLGASKPGLDGNVKAAGSELILAVVA